MVLGKLVCSCTLHVDSLLLTSQFLFLLHGFAFHCWIAANNFPVTRASFFYTYIPTMCVLLTSMFLPWTNFDRCHIACTSVSLISTETVFIHCLSQFKDSIQGFLNSVAYGWSCGDFFNVMWSRWKLTIVCTPLLWSFSSWIFSHFSFSAVYMHLHTILPLHLTCHQSFA